MENIESVEKKELISTPAEEMGGDTTDHQRGVQAEPSVSSSNLEREDKLVSSEMDSLNNDTEREDKKVPSEMDSLNNDIEKEDKKVPSEMDSLNNDLQREDQGVVPSISWSSSSSDSQREDQGEVPSVSRSSSSSDSQREDQGEVPSELQSSNDSDLQRDDQGELPTEMKSLNHELHREDQGEVPNGMQSSSNTDIQIEHQGELPSETQSLNKSEENYNQYNGEVEVRSDAQTSEIKELKPEILDKNRSLEEIISEEKEVEPVFDGSEDPEVDATGNSCIISSDLDPEAQGYGWPDKAVAIKNFVREKSVVAVSTVIRRLSGKKDEDEQNNPESEEKNDSLASGLEDQQNLNPDDKSKELSQKPVERSTWNPLSYIKLGRDADTENNIEQREVAFVENLQPPPLKGRILLYTRLGCQDCREVRIYLHQRKLRYVEVNIDVYPSRKLELEKYCGSSAVPLVFLNDHPIGGLSKLKEMEESGKLMEKINDLFIEEPSREAPVPPLSGEDDESCSGTVDELALIVRKMRETILVKDRFYRMRRFSNCFVGSEAVDFLSEDQYLERKEAIQFAQKLASKHFFRHVLEEHVFEDGTHLYRFLDHDPIVSSQCYNIPRGITDVKPKLIIDIASRLRFLSLAMFEAYTSVDGRHVDYRSIHGSEEFARYLRVVEELQRVELQEMSREEKLAFFINLYNMMAIHAILMWGYPVGPLERRKTFGDFKYVIGGYTYSLSAIENGILRCNQRPPYNLIKPFGARDQRAKIALPYPEPLIHFALVSGTRSGPALRCYSPSNIDKELMEAARNFLKNGGVIVDPETKVASVSKILRWYSADFGKNEVEILKHAANYLETSKSEELLELLANTQLKVVYQPYDWGVNC